MPPREQWQLTGSAAEWTVMGYRDRDETNVMTALA